MAVMGVILSLIFLRTLAVVSAGIVDDGYVAVHETHCQVDPFWVASYLAAFVLDRDHSEGLR
jgi:hypothetical protein